MMGAAGKTAYQTYVDQMFNLGGAAVTTLTAMNPGTTSAAGAYSPKANGWLKGIVIQVSGQAASSLAQSGYITLTCTQWAPVNTLTIPFTGFGLLTAPQLLGGNLEIQPWAGLDLPVNTSVPINGSVIYFYSPVTPNITVTGVFGAKLGTAAQA
jgi:hypothetical protein